MALLEPNTEELLQEIALELAFAPTGGHQSVLTLLKALQKLQKSVQVQPGAAEAQVAVNRLISWLEPLEAMGSPLGEEELTSLQQHYLAVEKALYAAAHGSGPAAAQQADQGPGPEPALNISMESKDDLELLNEFCNEGRELLSQVEQGVLVLEENSGHRETLNQVFRAFHTFKGGAGFLGLDPIKELAHILESLLDAARQNRLPIDRHVIDLILAGGDILRQFVDRIEHTIRSGQNSAPIVIPTSELIDRVSATLAGRPPSETAVPGGAAEPEVAPAPAQPTPVPAPVEVQPEVRTRPKPEKLSNFVKIDTQKLDALIDLVGELVIAKSMVVEHPLLAQQRSGDLPRHLRQLARISSDLQHNAMSLRMVPIRTTFQKMNRLVRDLAGSQNKQVTLVLKGEDTELDRNIVEALTEPLLHMMRNSIDHGLETAAERVALGKPAQGRIEIEASHQGGGILIRISDDGRGIDPSRILTKAREQGLVDNNFHGSQSEILGLIFQPGFSTAETVTEVSGRGVGMDVVQGSINRLRGRIDVESVLGEGTTFLIHLPLTLAIIDGMLVSVGRQRFILPTLAIIESFRPTQTMLSTVKGRGQVVNLRGNLIPVLHLGARLGLADGVQDPGEGIVLIINSSGQARGVLVDGLISKQEVVIKALGKVYENQQIFSGAAIMGDGQVALILDPDALGRPASQP
jgi:two-component system chemotaxis sensor kinase CheA